ncbi:MAG: Sir2 family NAD-dependent protein deacetylase [Micrococcales bacterium]|nr:Sir2 family NAD-dependent protein deacetylase [Micrococcales bacterium]MCL2667040.1 Sir2 family NAD-dependent protein deacetylase [Micrococcales bacterium]
MGDVAVAKTLVAGAERIVVLSGAGMSTAAGIPDFRGPQGVWTKDPAAERVSNLLDYLHDPQVRKLAWQRRDGTHQLSPDPTPAHRALVDLEATGRLLGIVTQNTDGLHLVAGNSPETVLEMHGNARRWRCESCAASGPMADQLARLEAGEDDPDCPGCGGITRATVILFGESLDGQLLDRAFDIAGECDLLVAIGTTLVVQPVASLVSVALQHGAKVIIVNAEPTPYDDQADAVLRGDIQDVVPELFAQSSA